MYPKLGLQMKFVLCSVSIILWLLDNVCGTSQFESMQSSNNEILWALSVINCAIYGRLLELSLRFLISHTGTWHA